MSKKLIASIFSVSLLAFIALLIQTNPTNLSSTILLIPFALLFLIIWSGSVAILRVSGMGKARAAKLSIVLASVPASLLLLQSIGQLGPWDIVTVAALAVIAYFYILKLAAAKQ